MVSIPVVKGLVLGGLLGWAAYQAPGWIDKIKSDQGVSVWGVWEAVDSTASDVRNALSKQDLIEGVAGDDQLPTRVERQAATWRAGDVVSSLTGGPSASSSLAQDTQVHEAQEKGVRVAFSPGGAEDLVLRTIQSSQRSIRLAAYSFTSRPIANALLAAASRGVDVRVVADESQRAAKYTSLRYLAKHGIPVRISERYAIMHNKFMVVDGSTVETGSFNYTRSAAKRNAENVVVLSGMPNVAATYLREWSRLWGEGKQL